MPELSDSQIRAVVDRIFDECEPEKVIVFGSQVSGETDEWSDLDLIVVIDADLEERKKITSNLYSDLAGIGFGKDIIVMTPERYRNLSEHPSSFIHSAAKKGNLQVYESRDRTVSQ